MNLEIFFFEFLKKISEAIFVCLLSTKIIKKKRVLACICVTSLTLIFFFEKNPKQNRYVLIFFSSV